MLKESYPEFTLRHAGRVWDEKYGDETNRKERNLNIYSVILVLNSMCTYVSPFTLFFVKDSLFYFSPFLPHSHEIFV